jgi:hypothetical protein
MMIANTQKTAATHAAMALPMLIMGDMAWMKMRHAGLNSNVWALPNDLAQIILRWFRKTGPTMRIRMVLEDDSLLHIRKGSKMMMTKTENIEKMALKKQ